MDAIGDTTNNAVEAVTPAPIKNTTEKVGTKVGHNPIVQKVVSKAQAFYDSLDPEEQRHIDAAFGFTSGASAIARLRKLRSSRRASSMEDLAPAGQMR
jgi:hypothetical protein